MSAVAASSLDYDCCAVLYAYGNGLYAYMLLDRSWATKAPDVPASIIWGSPEITPGYCRTHLR